MDTSSLTLLSLSLSYLMLAPTGNLTFHRRVLHPAGTRRASIPTDGPLPQAPTVPTTTVSSSDVPFRYTRNVVSWKSQSRVPMLPLMVVSSEGRIEDPDNVKSLHVDFANRSVGGGVLGVVSLMFLTSLSSRFLYSVHSALLIL